MAILSNPQPGALAYVDNEGKRQETNPSDPYFSTATMLATEYWNAELGWTRIYTDEEEDEDLMPPTAVAPPSPTPVPGEIPVQELSPESFATLASGLAGMLKGDTNWGVGTLTGNAPDWNNPDATVSMDDLPPLPHNPPEIVTLDTYGVSFEWYVNDNGIGGNAIFQWVNQSTIPIPFADRDEALQFYERLFIPIFRMGIAYTKFTMQKTINDL